MVRPKIAIGLLGLVAAATAASAQTATVVKETMLFGERYALTSVSLGGKYKNGLSVALPPAGDNATTLQFVEGDKAENDRLFVATTFADNDATIAHQFYELKGADAAGNINPATANLTEFFGGAVDKNRGGRIASVTWISDVDTGKGQDFNFAVWHNTDQDSLRFYDKDTLGSFKDSILSLTARADGVTDENTSMPNGGFMTGVPAANGNVLFIGRGEGSLEAQLGVFDPRQKKFLDVLTNLVPATQGAKIEYDATLDPHDFERFSDTEYLILASAPGGRGADLTKQVLYKARIAHSSIDDAAGSIKSDTIKAESIKVEITAQEVLFDAAAGIDKLGTGPGGVTGLAVGRRAITYAPPNLYFATRSGQLISAIALPPG
jgi:hypothetical protein